MAEHKHRLDEASAQVLVIGFEPPEKLLSVKQRLDSPFRFLCDTECEVYRAYGLGASTHLRVFAHPKMLARAVKVTLEGNLWRPRPGQDRLQLGGDFVVGEDGTVLLAHPEEGPEDRVAVGEIASLLATGASRPR